MRILKELSEVFLRDRRSGRLWRSESRLEQYRLPKEDERDAEQREDVVDESGKKIGERPRKRTRMIDRTKGPTGRIHDQNLCRV